eukprot:jgi/Tetstr1/428692/TSEL_018680.t1
MPHFESAGLRLAYLDEGRGEPILLIHGFASNKQVNWVYPGWVEMLVKAGRRVIAIDNRGHGESQGSHNPDDYGAPTMAEDARRLLDHLDLPRVDVMGYSMALEAEKLSDISKEEVARITQPVLVAVGTRDEIAGSASELAALMPRAEVLDIPNRDHMVAVGDKVYKAGALAFLESVAARGPVMSDTQIDLQGADGNRLIADVFGKTGRPALLFHGGGQTRHAWDATGARLAKVGLQAWSVDQRGHGDSDWAGRRPIAIGASLGGIASLLAEGALKPGTLSALVLVDITPRMDPSGVNKIISFMSERMHDGFGSVEEAADAIASYLPHRSRPKSLDGLSKNLRRHSDGRYRWHWDPRFIEQRPRWRRGRAASHRGGPDGGGTRAHHPGAAGARRAVGTRHDAHVEEFMTLVPHAQYADVKGAGHMVAGDRNDRLRRRRGVLPRPA